MLWSNKPKRTVRFYSKRRFILGKNIGRCLTPILGECPYAKFMYYGLEPEDKEKINVWYKTELEEIERKKESHKKIINQTRKTKMKNKDMNKAHREKIKRDNKKKINSKPKKEEEINSEI
jgi:U3 small nucleolar RNA-associated protein 14